MGELATYTSSRAPPTDSAVMEDGPGWGGSPPIANSARLAASEITREAGISRREP